MRAQGPLTPYAGPPDRIGPYCQRVGQISSKSIWMHVGRQRPVSKTTEKEERKRIASMLGNTSDLLRAQPFMIN
jgi:hypothetical protein